MQPADRLSRPRGVPSRLESQVSYRLHVPLIYVKAAYSTPNRSAVPRDADHLIHAMPIS